MSEHADTLRLFQVADEEKGTNVYGLPGTGVGVLPHHSLRTMEREGQIFASTPISDDQYQPASIDLRLGRRAWRVRASFLPGSSKSVMDRIEELDGLPEIDLTNGAVFEKGIVYVVELLEQLNLTNGLIGVANPKSSTGRLDVLVRLISDKATAFDRVERKYGGKLYLEVAPQAFSIVVRQGSRLNQLRFHRGTTGLATTTAGGVQDLYEKGQLIKLVPRRPLIPLRQNLVPVTVDLGEDHDGIVGYKAKKTTNKIDVDRVRAYDPTEFWDKIEGVGGRLYLDKGDFYILATREEVGVPPNLAAEMVPYDSASGEFRVHYAGFFDPGFGYMDGQAQGSKAVLEVRSYGVSFMLEHGQMVGWLNYSRLFGGPPKLAYGEAIKSNYQGQGVALAKHFRPWPNRA